MKTDELCPRFKNQNAVSLLETLFATGIVSMIFIAAMTLYISTARSTVKTQRQVFSGADAANASQAILELAREAYKVRLPDSAGFTSVESGVGWSGASLSDFTMTATVDDETRSVHTGVRLLFRRPSTVQVGSAAGTRTASVYDYSSSANPPVDSVWIYRGNSNGTPNKETGRFLCIRGSLTGRAALRPTLLSTVDNTSRTAVDFIRKADEPQLLRFEIRSMYYSPIGQNNAATSDTPAGGASQLTARCVILRSFEE